MNVIVPSMMMRTGELDVLAELVVVRLLRDVDRSFEYFDNELQPEVEQVVSTVRKIVKANKQLAKDATLQRQQAEEAKTDERQGPSSEATMS